MTQQRSLLRVGDFYEATYEPHYLTQAAPGTIAAYREALALWRALTEDPPLDQITNLSLAEFRTKLSQRSWRGVKLSPATVNKHLGRICAVLSKAGPPGPRNRDALGLIAQAAWARPLKVPRRRPRPIPLDVLGRIYAACDVATWPALTEVSAASWWRGAIVTSSQVGVRREVIASLLWDDVDLATSTLRVDASSDKCDEERRKPLKEVVRRHLLALRSRSEYVFCRAVGSTWKQFYAQWHRLQDAAGIPRSKHYKFHALKATCGTQVARVGGSHAVRVMLDHASITTSEHYVDAGDALREAIELVPHPVEFDGGFRDRDRDRG